MTIFVMFILLIFIKSITIGSEFNIYLWLRYGKRYYRFYAKHLDIFINSLKTFRVGEE